VPTGLPPVVDDCTRALVVGSLPGQVSLQMQQYYAHPRNAFWRIMSELLGFDFHADYAARLDALRAARIGLWDVLRLCERPGSLDSAIVRDSMQVNDFENLFAERLRITQVFFNGAKAEQVFRRLVAPNLVRPPTCVRLPSTSPANAGVAYDAKLRAWRAVVDVG
jgi:TDG/mug DNA glycosylase family protein